MNEPDSTWILPDIVDELVAQVDDLGLDVASFWAGGRPRHDPGPPGASPRGRNVRSEPRYPAECPLIAIPLQTDGRPDLARRMNGKLSDVSGRGIGALLATDSDSGLSGDMLIGVRGNSGEYRYAGVSLKHLDRSDEGGVYVGGELGGQIQEILEAGQITPVFRPDRMEFGFDCAAQLIESLEYLGVLEGAIFDRVQLCPQCQGVPTFRQGCRKCGSARLANDRLIHHLPCGHVGPVADFDTSQGLVCPKCRTRHLVAPADFEYLTGQYRCRDCHAIDTESEQIGHCLRCGLRFPGYQSTVQDVKRYHAHRLDPLGLPHCTLRTCPQSFVTESCNTCTDGRSGGWAEGCRP